jgi:hypothetical protein
LGERGPEPSAAKAGPAETVLNVDPDEPLPGEKLQPQDSEIDVVKGETYPLADLAEARRIARRPGQTAPDGAIKTAGDASFYANLIRDFGTAYAGPPACVAGEHPPDLVPQPPHCISPQERIKFYQEDLGHAFGEEFIDHAEEGYPPPRASRSSADASSTRK